MSDSYPDGDVYAVGKDNEGNTTLKMFYDGGMLTLRMNEKAVHRMIRLLKATLEEEDEVLDDQLP